MEQSALEIKTPLTLGQFSGRLKTEMFLRSYTTRQRSRNNFYYKTT